MPVNKETNKPDKVKTFLNFTFNFLKNKNSKLLQTYIRVFYSYLVNIFFSYFY